MDSGSGSLQSSSGGEEEYDSRAAADSVSAFMTSGGGGGTISNAPPQQQPPQPFFDPFSNYLQLQQNPINPTLSWPRTTFMPSFQSTAVDAENHHPSTLPPPPQNQNHTAARNPKKRSRASRRAPTTVLTTDTSNFRAMVQEFTGIPAPPFTNSPFPRSRLDLFGTRSTSAAQQPPPQYLRRPFPQKPQPTPLPFLASSFNSGGGVALDGAAMAASSSTTNNNNITSVSSSPAINNQASNFFISNPLLNSFLQTNPKFQPVTNPSLMGPSKTQNTFEIPSNAHQSQSKFMGFDEQFGLSHENHVADHNPTVLPNLIPSDQNNSHPDHGDKNINLRSINGGYNFQRNTTNFHGDKGPENGVGRGEGMVESWICSSE